MRINAKKQHKKRMIEYHKRRKKERKGRPYYDIPSIQIYRSRITGKVLGDPEKVINKLLIEIKRLKELKGAFYAIYS